MPRARTSRRRASLFSLLGPRRSRTTHQAGSSTANKFYSLLKENGEEIFRENDLYLSISEQKAFSSETNNAQYISIDLLNETLGVSDFHLTVSSFFKKRSDQGAAELKPLEGHIHCSLKYCDQEGDIHDIKLYYRHQPGEIPKIGLVANKSGKPLDPEIKRQIKAQAIAAMMPLIIKLDQFLQDFEHRKVDLESRITEANTQLATATGLSEKLHFAREARALYQQWFQLIGEEDYKYVKNLRNNALPRTDADGYTMQSTNSRLTKDKLDEILRATFRQWLSSLHSIIKQLEAEHAQSSRGHKSSTSAVARRYKKPRGRGKRKAAKKTAPRQEETLEDYLEKAGNWVAAYLQLQGALNRGDFPIFNQLLQGRMFKNKCILFYLDSESLGILCQPENIAVLKNILISQKDTLILDTSHNKAALADLIKKLIQTGNLEGLLALHKLRVNLDGRLRDVTGKGLMYHLIDVAYKENKDKFYAWFFVNLHGQGVSCLDNEQIVKLDFGKRMFWLEPLKRAACMGLSSLTRAFIKAGVKDRLTSVRYVLKKDEGKDEKGRCDVTACDFIVEDIVCGERLEDEELEAERLVEQSELLLALCNSHGPKEMGHAVATGAQIFRQLMQSEGGNKEEKTALLVDCLAKIFMVNRIFKIFKEEKKHTAPDSALVGAVYRNVGNVAKKLHGGRTQRNPRLAVARKLEEIRAWMALLKFAIHDAVCRYSRPGEKAGLIGHVVKQIDDFKQRYQPGMTLRADLDKGSQGQDQTVEFNPVHIVEIMVGKLLKLFPVDSVSVDKIVECIKAQVLFAFEDVEFNVLKHAERHVLDGFHLMLIEQPVSNTALAKVGAQGQAADGARNDPKMIFLEHQQVEPEVSVSKPQSVQACGCG